MIRDLARSRSLIATPALLILVILYLDRATGPRFYGAAMVAQAVSAVAIIAPVCVALAAWEGSRLRRGGGLLLAPDRGELSIAVRCLTPIALLALVGIATATARMLSSRPSVKPNDFVLLLVPLCVIAGHISLAYVLGRRLPTVFALPLAPIASWLWIVYPIALQPLWIRHLTGYFLDCCDIATVPAPSAILAPILIGVAMVVAAAVVLSAIQIAVRLSIAAGVLASALVVGALLVSGLGADPVETRSASALRCQPGSPRVCLWPENESVAPLVSREAERISSNLARIGIRTPQIVSEARSAAGRTWLIGVTPEARAIDIDSTLIQGLLPSYPACADGTTPYFGYDAFWPVALWLGQKTGARLQGLQRNLTDEERREVSAVSKLPLAAQLSWFRTNRRAIGHCNVKPHFLTEKL